MAENNDRGTFGEQGAGFSLGPQGFFFIDGPSGKGGHASNASGFDGVAYSVTLDRLILYDNKTFESSRNISSATAIDPAKNLAGNLDSLIAKVQTMQDLPARVRILSLLTQTRQSLDGRTVSPPANVLIAVTNFGGNSRGVTKASGDRGVTFIDTNGAPPVPAQRIYLNRASIPFMAKPVAGGGVSAYNARRDRVAAVAEAARVVSQGLNDFGLKRAIDRELERLAPSIFEAIARGGGALSVVNINVSSPAGNSGMVVARSVNSAYVGCASEHR